jgi:hypothetical protein
MRFNKPLRNQQVRLDCGSIDDALSPGWKSADFGHGGVV